MSIIPTDPWIDPPDDHPGQWRFDVHHAHECPQCRKRMWCYGNGCGLPLYVRCGACR